jgi:hypothetical protein
MEEKEVRLEAVASLPGTDGSNPFPSSGESANFRFLASIIPAHKELARIAVLDCPGLFLCPPRTHRSAGRPTASPTSCPKDSSSELPSGSAIRAT